MPYQVIIVETTIAVSHAPTKNITDSITSWSATVPTSFTGVVAVSELCTFLVVIRPPSRASRPTYIPDIAHALVVAPAATLPQGSCRESYR